MTAAQKADRLFCLLCATGTTPVASGLLVDELRKPAPRAWLLGRYLPELGLASVKCGIPLARSPEEVPAALSAWLSSG